MAKEGKAVRECRHCHKVKTREGRGLCHACWNNLEIREQYARLPNCRPLHFAKELDDAAIEKIAKRIQRSAKRRKRPASG